MTLTHPNENRRGGAEQSALYGEQAPRARSTAWNSPPGHGPSHQKSQRGGLTIARAAEGAPSAAHPTVAPLEKQLPHPRVPYLSGKV